MITQAMKLPAKGDFDGARKKLTEAETFVKQHNLSDDYLKRIKADRDNIDAVQNDVTARKNLEQSNSLYESATTAIGNGQYDQANQALDQLQGLGKGAAHQDEIQNLRSQISTYKQQDQAFEQAKTMAQSNDVNTLRNAKQSLSQFASGGGRHAKEAAGLVDGVQRSIDKLVAAEYKGKMDAAQSVVLQAISAKDKGTAQAKLSDLQTIGSDPNFPSSLKGELNNLISSDNSKIAAIVVVPPPSTPPSFVVSCSVIQTTRKEYTSTFKPGQQMAQMFLDKDLELKGGQNCGLPTEGLQKGEWRLLVGVDTSGSVTDFSVLMGDAGFGAKIGSAAKGNWHFTPPTLKNQPVQTKVAVVVRVN